MIKPLRLIITNFMSIGSATLDLADQGLVAIKGVNLDDPTTTSNGSGKSSLVDAISWCLFGATARGITGDNVVNIKAGKNTLVEMEVEIDGDVYTITRGRKHKNLKNRVTVRRGKHDVTLGTDRQTQSRINNLLGCGLEVFNAAIYMGQENMPDLPNMTDKELKAVLEEVLSLDKLDLALEQVNETLRINEAATTSNDYASKRAVMDIANSNDTIIHYQVQAKNIIETIETIEASMEAMRRDEADVELELEDQIKDLFVAMLKAPEREDRPAKLAAARAARLGPIEEKMKGVEYHLREHLSELDRQTRLLNSMQGHTCGECKRPYDHAPTTDAINNQEKIVGKMSAKISKLESARKKLSSRWYIESKVIEDEHLVADPIKDKDTIREEMAALKKRLACQKDKFSNNINGLETTVRLQKNNLARCNEEIAAGYDRVDRFEGELKKLDHELSDLKAAQDRLGKVKYAFGRKGFRGEILDQVTPYLNNRTDHYLTALTGGAIAATWVTLAENSDGDYVENFHIEIKHQSGVTKFGQLSGGEKRKVRLACALALQDLVSTRAVKPIKLFVADEIDDALDEAGLELLMGVLEAKARAVGTVYMVSHTDLSDWCRNHITVTKEYGVSSFNTH